MRKQSYSQAFFICELRLAILDVLFGYCAVLPYVFICQFNFIPFRKHRHRQQRSAEAEDQEEGQETFFHGVFPFRRQILSASRQNSGISRWVVDGFCAIITCRWEKGKDFGDFFWQKKASPSRGGGSA